MTNADIIRQMSDDELAEMLSHFHCYASDHGCDDCLRHMGNCAACWLEWLKQEAKSLQ